MTFKAVDENDVATILSGFESIGHAISIWSDEEKLISFNQKHADVFSGNSFRPKAGQTLQLFYQQIINSGVLIFQVLEEDWLQSELDAFRTHQPSDYIFSSGRIYQTERWPMRKGYTIALLSDVTDDRRNLEALIKARDKAMDTGNTKSRFLRAANHDLRQPLASLKILIYNCMSADDSAQREHLLHAMDISVSIMEDLLGALLNIGQLDAGQIKPKITTFQLSTLLERLKIEYGHQAKEKGLKFRIVPCKVAVESDRALLERIVSNFVGNAIRYTETGGILIGCRRSGGQYRLEIWDTGRGISSEFQSAIFDEFFQIHEKTIHEKRKGLGLGLNISKRIADILDHKISVRSVPGRGSVFSITLPEGDLWHSDIGEPEISERIGGEFKGLSAIVLEDDEILRNALTELLERWGIIVIAFNAVDDVVDYLRVHCPDPDLIITDFRLRGGFEGTEVVQDIRRGLKTDCPAVVVTADTDPTLLKDIRAKGFPVLIKPVSPPSLRVMMHSMLYEPELLRELSEKD